MNTIWKNQGFSIETDGQTFVLKFRDLFRRKLTIKDLPHALVDETQEKIIKQLIDDEKAMVSALTYENELNWMEVHL